MRGQIDQFEDLLTKAGIEFREQAELVPVTTHPTGNVIVWALGAAFTFDGHWDGRMIEITRVRE